MIPRRRFLLALAGVLAALAGIFAWRQLNPPLKQHSVHPSPDGKYRVIVYKLPMRGIAMPGQGSDAPALIRLVDAQDRVLAETKIDIIQAFTEVEWKEGSVNLPLIAEWKLP